MASEEWYGGDNIRMFETRDAAEAWAREFYASGETDSRIVEVSR